MDTRNNVLIVGAYLVGAVIVLSTGLGYFAYRRSLTPQVQVQAEDANESEAEARHRALTARYAATVRKSGPTLRELESKLASSREMLEKAASDLSQRNADLKRLRAERDESLMLLVNVLSENASTADDPGETTQRAKAKFESELGTLRESIGKAEVLDEEREKRFAELQVALTQADLELALVQEESRRELAGLLAEKQALENTTSAFVARFGEIAVAWLVELLDDERVEIRRWSARTLGALGQDAQEAAPALQELLVDPDADVRALAQRALRAIAASPAP